MKEIKEIIQKIIIKLSLHKSLFVIAVQSYNNSIEIVNTHFPAPAWTDGRFVFINEKFNVAEVGKLLVLIMHEYLHILLLHFSRMKNKDPMLWNLATDYVINTTVIPTMLGDNSIEINGERVTSSDVAKIIKSMNGCYNRDYFGKTEEEVYRLLKDEQQRNPQKFKSSEDSESRTVTHGDATATHKKSVEVNEAEAEIMGEIFKEAVKKIKGEDTYILNKILANAFKIKIDIKKALANAINTIVAKGGDYSWSKVKPAGLTLGRMLPGIADEEKNDKLFIAIDESSSLSENDLGKFAEVISKFLGYFNELIIVRHSDKIADIKEFKDIDKNIILKELKKRYSYGGTSHKEVFELINKKYKDISLFIFLTDGYSDLDEFKPFRNLILVMGEEHNQDLKNYKKIIFEG